MQDEYDFILDASLLNPTQVESSILSGKKARDYVSFFRDVHQSEAINPRHFDFFNDLTAQFRQAIGSTSHQHITHLHFENDRLTAESLSLTRASGLAVEDSGGKKLTSLTNLHTFVYPNSVFSTLTATPVKWHMDHIAERMASRGSNPLTEKAPIFFQHNALALSMLRILEEEHNEHVRGYHAFLLPERDGVLLGHTVPMAARENKNRVVLMAAAQDIRNLRTVPYEWIPTMNMTVRTYYGPKEMTPAMHRLRNRLLPFYGGEKAKALQLELDSVDDTQGSTHFETHPRRDNYINAFLDLSDIMQSSEWKLGTQLPQHLRPTLTLSP